MAFCGCFAQNHLLCDDVVPDTFHQLEPVAGEREVRPVPEAGGHQENNRGGDIMRYVAFRVGSDVLGANSFFPFEFGNQYLLYRQIDSSRFYPADERPFPGAGAVVGDVAGGNRRADVGRAGRLETGGWHPGGHPVLCGIVPGVQIP